MQFRLSPRVTDIKWFDVGLAADPPQLVDPSLDLAAVRRMAAHPITATVWDTADHRLLRAGVVLARRTVDGVTQWYLDAPDWQPDLPADTTDDHEGDTPPQHWLNLLTIFLRGQVPAPAADITCDREQWEVRTTQREVAARLTDDRVVIERDGLTTARYREVALEQRQATSRQAGFLTDALVRIGAAPAPAAVPLADRIGAPANGPADFRRGDKWRDRTEVEDFLPRLWATRLTEIAEADLAARADVRKLGGVVTVLRRFQREIRGLAPILGSDWVSDADHALARVGRKLTGDEGDAAGLDDPDYLALVDRLVAAMRFPRVLESAVPEAMTLADLVRALVENALDGARTAVDDLSEGAPQKTWDAAVRRAEGLVDACAVADLLSSTRNRRFTKRAVRLAGKLATATSRELRQIKEGVATLSPEEAFAAGRRYEVMRQGQAAARAEVVAEWPSLRRKLVWP